MAFKIIWSQTASEDLKAIVLYVGHDDPAAAARLGERILERVEAAAQFPYANRIVPEKADRWIREAILNPYRLIFHVGQARAAMHVLRIWHAARGAPDVDSREVSG